MSWRERFEQWDDRGVHLKPERIPKAKTLDELAEGDPKPAPVKRFCPSCQTKKYYEGHRCDDCIERDRTAAAAWNAFMGRQI